MKITEVELGGPEFHGYYEATREVTLDAWPGDPPWASEAKKRELYADREDADRILFVAEDSSGEVTGAADVYLPTKDNRHAAHVGINVRPTCRSQGIGRELLEFVEQRAADRERTVFICDTSGRVASLDSRDARFATNAGYQLARTEARRELRLPLADDQMAALESANAPYASDYDTVSWWGRCPDHLVESLVKLSWTLTADEPRGDLDVEAEHFDVDRVRRWEEHVAKTGREHARTGAVCRATGELAAITEIGVPRSGEGFASQFATVVAREHRGHRLGILVKLANLRLVKDHELAPTRVSTWNAESNGPMIRVNEEMGFEVAGRAFNWQKTVGR